MHNHKTIETEEEILGLIASANCYVLWVEYNLPMLKTNVKSVLENRDDVTIMAFDTWLIGENRDWILEFHHEGKIRFMHLKKDGGNSDYA